MTDDAHERIAELRMEIERLTRERDEAREYAVKRSEEAHRIELELHDRAEAAEWMVELLREALAFYAQLSTYQTRTVSTSGERARAEAAERKVEKLRAALAPFVKAIEHYAIAATDEYPIDRGEFSLGDLRRARAALKETQE